MVFSYPKLNRIGWFLVKVQPCFWQAFLKTNRRPADKLSNVFCQLVEAEARCSSLTWNPCIEFPKLLCLVLLNCFVLLCWTASRFFNMLPLSLNCKWQITMVKSYWNILVAIPLWPYTIPLDLQVLLSSDRESYSIEIERLLTNLINYYIISLMWIY